MAKYIRVEDSKYPFRERDIKLLFPNTSFCKPFKKEGFEVVFSTPKPEITDIQVVVEGNPVLTGLGAYAQTWITKDRFQDINGGLTKAQQESAYIAQKQAETDARESEVTRLEGITAAQEKSGLKQVTIGQATNYITNKLNDADTIAGVKQAVGEILIKITSFILK